MHDEPVDHTPLARLGRWAHSQPPTWWSITWAVVVVALGVFAPRLEHALSGAMWEVNGSDSLAAREIIDQQFGGLSSQSAAVVVHSDTLTVDDPAFQQAIADATAVLATEPAFGPAMPPQPGMDGQTVMIQAGALVDPTEAVRAAERLHDEIGDVSNDADRRSRSPAHRRSGATSTPSTARG